MNKVTPYKSVEFQEFIKTIEEGYAGHWVDIATALSVDADTITKWKNLPEAQEAIRVGIIHALKCMQQAGARDWRMWEAKLKMLGVNPSNKLDLNVRGNPAREILDAMGLTVVDHDGKAPKSS